MTPDAPDAPRQTTSAVTRDPFTLPEILAALEARSGEVAGFFAALPAATFFAGDSKQWGPAYHLRHLALSNARLAYAFAAGASLPRHPTGRSRRYAEMRDFCVAEIERVPRSVLENNPFTPSMEPSLGQPEIVAEYEAAGRRLRAAVASWTEADCDARALRHPFFGPFTGREMLLFVLLHDKNHLVGVRRRMERSSAP